MALLRSTHTSPSSWDNKGKLGRRAPVPRSRLVREAFRAARGRSKSPAGPTNNHRPHPSYHPPPPRLGLVRIDTSLLYSERRLLAVAMEAKSAASGSSCATTQQASICALPSEVLDLIGFYCAMFTPGTQAEQSAAIGQASGEAQASSSSTPARPEDDYIVTAPPAFATPPTNLRNLLMTCRKVHAALDAKSNPRLYARVFHTKFDVAAIARRFGAQAMTAESLTMELKRRCICLKRIRKAVAQRRLKEPFSGAKADAEVLDNLWLAYMMMTENDGLNIAQLRWAQIEAYLKLYRSQNLLQSIIKSGYPANTPDVSLALHVEYMLTDPTRLAKESRDESDEKLFILRPFVFAAHRYDAYFAPWTLRNLPTPQQDSSTAALSCSAAERNPFIADLNFKDTSVQLQHCGQEISIRPPNVTHASCSSFFMKVERDPGVSGLNSVMDVDDDDDDSETESDGQETTANGKRPARKLCSKNPLNLRSRDHDKDVNRLLTCVSPYRSLGLNALAHIGDFEGSWEGRFTFFDFDSYRDMLGGKIRSLYEGPFGEQPQVWKIREHVVKINYADQEGGKGSLLNAGYFDDDDEPSQRPSLSAEELAKLRGSSPSMLGKRRVDWDQARNRALKGCRLEPPSPEVAKDWHNYPSFGADEPTENSSMGSQGHRCEILLSGTGHSAWGHFVLRGRVRSWDGMVSMTKEYRPDGRGRWLYRGYVTAGNKMVGRWRDTFTPQDMSGYEG